jgi:RNA polymerase sigma-70 factor (ECF subfamily)
MNHPGPSLGATSAADSNLNSDELARLLACIPAQDAAAERAFTRFYDLTSPRAYALARRIVGEDAAEDVLEETYWQVWRDAGRYQTTRGVPMAWLLTICRSRALDWLRRQDDTVALDDSVEQLPDTFFATPVDMLESLEAQTLVAQAMQSLDAKERQMIACAYFRDMSHSEIAVHCQMPVGSVKTVLHRALGKLRAYMAELNPNHVRGRMENMA